MAFLVKLPPLGEGIFEAQMVARHKQVGDEVKEGDVIAEMETDKATGALAAPVSGVIKEFYIEIGDYIFRDEKVLLIDDGKEELTTGAGGDAGRVNEDGSIVAPPEGEKLAIPKLGPRSKQAPAQAQPEKPVQATEQPKLAAQPTPKPAAEQPKEPEHAQPTKEVEKPEAATPEQEQPVFKLSDDGEYYVVEKTGSVAEIFKRFYGEDQPQAPAAKPDMKFMSEQGQAQQGKPIPSTTRKHRYLEPLKTNFQHSLDGSQPIPTHVANEVPYEELLKRGENVKVAPALRKYAAENHIDLSELPTDENGMITKEMIDLAISHAVGEREWNYKLIDEYDPGYWTHRPEEEAGREETYIRKYNASRYEMSHRKVPPFSVTLDIDMTKLQQYIELRYGAKATKNSVLPYFIRAIVIAAHRYPELNSAIDDVVSVFRFKSYVNVGIEMNTVQGLFTPVIKDAHLKSYHELEESLNELEHEVKVERIFNYETNSDSTITITDVSEFGYVENFVPIIQHPNAAIFGLAGTRDKAVVVEGEVVVRPMQPMTLVSDARILTRDKAVRVANFIKDMIEEPSYLFEMDEALQAQE